MDLELELRALEIDWPETPAFALREQPRRRWRWAAVAAIAAAAIAAAFAVPQSRGAILRFFHLGGATIQVVDTLPPAQNQASLSEGLGDVIPLDGARRTVSRLLVPPVDPLPSLHLAAGNIISVVFEAEGAPVLLSEIPNGGSGGGAYLKKLASGETRVEGVQVGPDRGLFLSGRAHVVVFPRRSPRLAGPVLIWEHGGTTYRLEGPELTRATSLRIAASLRRG
jgi:hypothetical protein